MFEKVLTPDARVRLCTNIANAMEGVPDEIIQRQLSIFERVHPDYKAGVQAALEKNRAANAERDKKKKESWRD